jgi:hypothetical protein
MVNMATKLFTVSLCRESMHISSSQHFLFNIVPGRVSWPVGPMGLLARGKKKVGTFFIRWFYKTEFVQDPTNCKKKHSFNNVIPRLNNVAVQRILLEWISGKVWTGINLSTAVTVTLFKHFITTVSLCIRKICIH